MRSVWIAAVGLAVACSNGKSPVDSSAGDTSASTDTAEGGHPLVPDEYDYLWDTDGCTTESGEDGVNVYWLAEGSADEDGHMVMTERWFWFLGRGDVEEDCVDTFDVTGTFTVFDYEDFSCEPCEEAYELERVLSESSCGIGYGDIFGTYENPATEPYRSIELFDTLTPTGSPNWDDVMDVMHAQPEPPDQDVSWLVSLNWARGHAYPEGDPGYPSDYDWVGEACYQIGAK